MIKSFLKDAALALALGALFTANLYACIGAAIFLHYRYFI
jgi:hypothetical protein